MCKKIALIGSTGSIGKQVLEVVENNPEYKIVSLTANTNRVLLEEQITKYMPEVACLCSSEEKLSAPSSVKTYVGKGCLCEAVTDSADLVFVAVTGFVGLEVVLRAIEKGKTVALANKEALVCGGELVTSLARKKGVDILPVDSEHSALWQALNFKKIGFKKLILTASGGPFRQAKMCDMRHFSANDALAHPNWSMGKKITVDCATMLNKGFEVIEAHYLFSAPLDRIDVIVHPQSIIHSMVEFEDNSILAEMSVPDMRQPIQMALTYPEKKESLIKPLDLISLGKLEFFPLDREKFPCFDLAIEALKMGYNFPTALNASSEVAVQAFLEDRILFTEIAEVISCVLGKTERAEVDFTALFDTDEFARSKAKAIIKQIENRR